MVDLAVAGGLEEELVFQTDAALAFGLVEIDERLVERVARLGEGVRDAGAERLGERRGERPTKRTAERAERS